MCSNFGLDHHPNHRPDELQRIWADKLIRLYWWFRRKLFVREIDCDRARS